MLAKRRFFVAVFLSIVMLLSSFVVFTGVSQANSSNELAANPYVSSGAFSPATTHNGVALHTPNIATSKADLSHGTLNKYAYLPDYKAADRYSYVNGHVVPLYSVSPAPMGIGDIGLNTSANGSVQAYNLSTSSFEGTMSLNNLKPF